MSWVLLSLLSALTLGVYDLLKNASVQDNAVLPVLFFSVVSGAFLWLPFVFWSGFHAESLPVNFLYVAPLSLQHHLALLAKSALVATSWMFGYAALKQLPMSTAGPIRSTGPLWTIFIAVLVLGETPTSWQWLGMLVILGAFYAFSFVGKLEGIHFVRNRWVWFMVIATLLGATSSLYDKYLLQRLRLAPSTVQAWFSLYLVLILLPTYFLWRRGIWATSRFTWRWSIPLIGISLLFADILYFTAVSQPDALISVISPLRRCSVLITFIGGVWLFHERSYARAKVLCLAFLLVGVGFLHWRS